MSEFIQSTFVLAVRDLAASRRYYTQALGFTEDLAVAGWSFLSRGACHLRLGHCPDVAPMSAHTDHAWFAYLHVSDAQALYREYQDAGVTIGHPLQDQPWGLREFAIITPDGHRIVFGQELD